MERSELEHRVLGLIENMRSIGLEDAFELLMDLLFARWLEARRGDETWQQLHQSLAASPKAAEALGLELLAGLRTGSSRSRSFDIDDGRALRHCVAGVDSWLPPGVGAMTVQRTAHEAFEATLRLRSARVSRAAAEFETPPNVARLMIGILDPVPDLIDPACGYGNLLMEAARRGFDNLSGYEIDKGVAARCKMRLALAEAEANISVGDGMVSEGAQRASAVVLHPPWGTAGSESSPSLVARLPFGSSKASDDLVWLQIALLHLRRDGRAAVLLPGQSASRGQDAQLRAEILKAGVVEAVIRLPLGTFLPASNVEACLWVLAGEAHELRDPPHVLLIDAAEMNSDVAASVLTEGAAKELTEAVLVWRDNGVVQRSYCRAVPLKELVSRGVVEPSRYISTRLPAPTLRLGSSKPLLSALRLSNFKSFGREHTAPLAPLTLIYGANSAGKSSLLQSLLVLKQSIRSATLVTQGSVVDAGSFEGLLHRHDTTRPLELGFTYGPAPHYEANLGTPGRSVLREMHLTFGGYGSTLPVHRAVELRIGIHRLPFEVEDVEGRRSLTLSSPDLLGIFRVLAEGAVLSPLDSRLSGDPHNATRATRDPGMGPDEAHRLLMDSDPVLLVRPAGLLPSAELHQGLHRLQKAAPGDADADPVASYVDLTLGLASGVANEIYKLFDELIYVGPLRSPPRRYYNRATETVAGTGERTALHLFDNSSELKHVNEWLGRLEIPYTLELLPIVATGASAVVGELIAMVLRDRRSDIAVSPADVGFGISQVLPIVVELLAHQSTVICVEQPEIHLHPALQARLTDLLIESTMQEGRANQLIIETHSEHIMLRVQRRIREGSLAPDDVSVIYIDQDEHGESVVERLRLDQQGDFLDEWPHGFFDERLSELFA